MSASERAEYVPAAGDMVLIEHQDSRSERYGYITRLTASGTPILRLSASSIRRPAGWGKPASLPRRLRLVRRLAFFEAAHAIIINGDPAPAPARRRQEVLS
jgi:hypothetical protein